MSKSFNNLSELTRFLNKTVHSALVRDVGAKVKHVMQEHVEKDVYAPYSPAQYKRTGRLAKEIEVISVSEGVSITPVREERGNYIPLIIETGQGYTWKGSEIYKTKQRRPFVENTKKEILNGNIHVEELRNSLRKSGLDVK